MYELLKKLTAPGTAASVSGRERRISDVVEVLIAPYVDTVSRDALGNVIAVRKGSGAHPEKVLLAAHLDEIGFFVTYIEENGFLRVTPVGGVNFSAASFCEVISARGVRGVLAREQDEEQNPSSDKYYIDIGAKDRRDAERKVRVGEPFALLPCVKKLMHQTVVGRPLDDRIGCAILLRIAEQMTKAERNREVIYVFTVQEEVGCRGAMTAAYGICPDEAIIFDVTGTGDVPGAKPMECRLGGGAAIKLKDRSLVCDAALTEALGAIAKASSIRHQYEILAEGGTDASSVQVAGGGCRAAALSVPTRYTHTGSEVLDLGDAEDCVKLAVAYLER